MTSMFSVRLTALLGASALVSGCRLLGPVGLGAAPAPSGPAVAAVDARTLVYPALPDVAPPAVRRAELSNGLVVFLAEDHALPVVRATARVGAGSFQDPAAEVGLARIAAESMRTGGAGDLDADALNLALESVGASVEAGAGDDATTVSMRALTETVDAVLPLFAAVITAPRFEAEPVALAKAQQASAIARRNDDPAGVAQREFALALYGADSPYARVPQVWTVDAVSRADAAAWHRRWVVPANTALAVWGDFDADDMVARLEAAFAGWQTPDGFEAPETPQPEARSGRRVLLVDRPDVNQSTIYVGHPGAVRRDSPDYPALVVMNEILGGGFPSRLYRTVRTDLGLAYGVFGAYTADFLVPGLFYAGTATRSDATVEATRAVLDVTASLATTPPTDDELRLAKESYLNAFVFNYDTRAEVLGRQLTYAAYGYPADFLEALRRGVEAVTAEDVSRVARAYLRPDSALVLVVGDAAAFGEPLTALGPVETVDTAIPAVPPPGSAAAGASGPAALAAVATALGGRDAFAAIRALRTEGETAATLGGQPMTIGTTTLVRLPDGDRAAAVRSEQRLPVGTVTIVLGEGVARVVTPAGPQDAPAAVVEQVRAQLFLSLPYLLAQADRLDVQVASGDTGGLVLAVRTPDVGATYLLTVGPDGRPTQVATAQLTPAGETEVVVRFEDYREVATAAGPLTLPFRYVQTVGGAPAGQTQLSAVEVNPALADDAFRAE
jgi:zinc protease